MVLAEGLREVREHERGSVRQPIQDALQSWRHMCIARCPVRSMMPGQTVQVVALIEGEVQHASQYREHLLTRLGALSSFETAVVIHRHRRQVSDFLPA